MARLITPAAVLTAAETLMLRPWNWARGWHCLGDAADVFQALWGVDPMAPLRDAARTYGGWRRIAKGGGGMESVLARTFRASGLITAPETTGQIGIVPSDVGAFGGRAVAICIQPGFWAGKAKEGLQIMTWHGEGWSCPG